MAILNHDFLFFTKLDFYCTEILSEAMKGMIHQCVQEFLSNQKESNQKEEELAFGVAVLFDADEVVGSFTFVGRDIGITAFHAVYVEEEGRIHEESLNLKVADAANIKLKHIVSYPFYDIAIYKLQNATAPKYFDIHFESIAAGKVLVLVNAHLKMLIKWLLFFFLAKPFFLNSVFWLLLLLIILVLLQPLPQLLFSSIFAWRRLPLLPCPFSLLYPLFLCLPAASYLSIC